MSAKSVPKKVVATAVSAIEDFLRLESAGGILLIAAGALALLVANSPAAGIYDALLETHAEVRIGALGIDRSLLHWINDGLMAIFFLLVGLEIKREVLEGELSDSAQVTLPVIAAIGGMAIPSAIFVWLNSGNPAALGGWAIPTATDIAFALGVLALLGKRVPGSLKLFLLTVAIVDDLGAILIIALFYADDLAPVSLVIAAVILAILIAMNRLGVVSVVPFVLLGTVLWAAVLKSGVHATLAGVLLAFCIPLRVKSGNEHAPLRTLERDLHPSVAYGILPLFAFANAGVALGGTSWSSFLEPVPLGVLAGLFIGKPAGVLGASWLAIRLGVAKLPEGAGWPGLWGVAMLCGIGFTMSLFIGTLAFENAGSEYASATRLGIVAGSLLSALGGFVVLRFAWRNV